VTLPIQPWSKDKLELLDKYLRAYTTIMRRQPWLQACSYIDAFAGVGQYVDRGAEDRDAEQYIDGSPLVALACIPVFDDFRFVDLSANRVEQLRQLVQRSYPDRQVAFRTGDANAVLANEVARQIRYENYRRGLAFIDPYGLQVRWETIEALAATRALDLFINFPIMAINRVLPRDAQPGPEIMQLLGTIFRGTEWIGELYSVQGSLFDDPVSRRPRLSARRVAEHYIEGLKALFRHVSEPVIMRNSMSSPLYALVLASHNQTAADITNDIFDRYDQLKLLDDA
jgi:three-Cys-motif partner protein